MTRSARLSSDGDATEKKNSKWFDWVVGAALSLVKLYRHELSRWIDPANTPWGKYITAGSYVARVRGCCMDSAAGGERWTILDWLPGR
jgi:hypothetical protein